VTGGDIIDGLSSLARRPAGATRSISAENRDGNHGGAPGGGARATEGTGGHAARELGPGGKVSPAGAADPSQCSSTPASSG